MFTTVDKAIAAVLGGLLSALVLWGVDIPEAWRTPEVIATVSGLISGVLTWAIPNRS